MAELALGELARPAANGPTRAFRRLGELLVERGLALQGRPDVDAVVVVFVELAQADQLRAELLDHVGVGGVFEDVFHLAGVLLQVEQLPFRRRGRVAGARRAHRQAVVEDQFMLVCPHAEVRRHAEVRHVQPVAVVHALWPVGGRLAPQDGPNASALHVLGDRHAGVVQERLGEVDVHDDGVAGRARLDLTRVADEEWHPQRFLVHEPLVEHPVLAEVEPLVGRVDHDRILREALGVEVVQHAFEVVVDGRHAAKVALDVDLVALLDACLARQPLGLSAVRGVTHADLLRDAFDRLAAVAVIVEQRRRFGDVGVLVHLGVLLVVLEHVVRGFVVVHEAERLVLRPLFEKLQRHVGDDVGDVALVLAPLAHFGHIGVEVLALPGQDVPVVEPRRLAPQMPLAHHPRVVSRLLQQFRERLLRAVEPVEPTAPVLVAVLARGDCRAAGRTDRVRAEAVVQPHALGRQAIDVRRLVDPAAVAADGRRGVVVGHDEQDVRPFGRRGLRGHCPSGRKRSGAGGYRPDEVATRDVFSGHEYLLWRRFMRRPYFAPGEYTGGEMSRTVLLGTVNHRRSALSICSPMRRRLAM